MTERKYLPTLADLIDRLSIVLMKRIFIGSEYDTEIRWIKSDIDLILIEAENVDANFIYAILVIMLSNRYIWENEAASRQALDKGDLYAGDRLRATHSVNGVRNRAKNIIASHMGERIDLKTDCLAADLPPEFGNWNVL